MISFDKQKYQQLRDELEIATAKLAGEVEYARSYVDKLRELAQIENAARRKIEAYVYDLIPASPSQHTIEQIKRLSRKLSYAEGNRKDER